MIFISIWQSIFPVYWSGVNGPKRNVNAYATYREIMVFFRFCKYPVYGSTFFINFSREFLLLFYGENCEYLPQRRQVMA